MGDVTRYWVEDKFALHEGGPSFANIANSEEAIEVRLAADYDALRRVVEQLRVSVRHAMNELGVPGPGYLALVTNTYNILSEALAEADVLFKDPS